MRTLLLCTLLVALTGCATLAAALVEPALATADAGLKAVVAVGKAEVERVANKAEGTVTSLSAAASAAVLEAGKKADAKIASAGQKLIDKGEEQGGPWGDLLKTFGALLVGGAGVSAAKRAGLKQGAALMAADPANGGADRVKEL